MCSEGKIYKREGARRRDDARTKLGTLRSCGGVVRVSTARARERRRSVSVESAKASSATRLPSTRGRVREDGASRARRFIRRR